MQPVDRSQEVFSRPPDAPGRPTASGAMARLARQLLGALGLVLSFHRLRVQQLRGRYVDQLQKSEDRVAEQTAARQKLAERRDEKRKALDRRITELAFENKL